MDGFSDSMEEIVKARCVVKHASSFCFVPFLFHFVSDGWASEHRFPPLRKTYQLANAQLPIMLIVLFLSSWYHGPPSVKTLRAFSSIDCIVMFFQIVYFTADTKDQRFKL